jgi:hypothetical protein
MRPEVAGYAWDEHVGEPEVAATLARLIAENKLESRVESSGRAFLRQHVLHLELRVPRGNLQRYEKDLVDGFFAPNATTTSTLEIRERYKRTGFDPARLLRHPVTELFERIPGIDAPRVKAKRWQLRWRWRRWMVTRNSDRLRASPADDRRSEQHLPHASRSGNLPGEFQHQSTPARVRSGSERASARDQ